MGYLVAYAAPKGLPGLMGRDRGYRKSVKCI